MDGTRALTISRRVASVPPSATLRIGARAKQLAAEGASIVNLGAGEPDFDTPDHVRAAAIHAMQTGQTKYAPVAGLPALRQAIAEKLEKENGLTYKPEQVVVSAGAKHSLYNILMAICDDGDEVIIPSPYWLSYPEMVKMAGGCPVFVPGLESNDFRITPDALAAAITDRSVAVILNSPSNPTGCVYGREELAALARVAVEAGLTIISDEIYEKMIYDGKGHVSVAGLGPDVFERTVTVNGFSKAYSMTGWRLGYFAGPPVLAKAVTSLQGHSTSGVVTFAQYGALAALQAGDECVRDMARAFEERRNCLYEGLIAIDRMTCVRPGGAFYAFPNIGAYGLDSMTFAERLLDGEGVAIVPGLPFGSDEHIRISYACSLDDLREGLVRLERFVGGL